MTKRIDIKWKTGVEPGAKNRLRQGRGLKRVLGYDRLEADGWEVLELPHGISKKESERQVEWLKNHQDIEPGMVEFEGFGAEVPITETPAPLSVEAVDEWYQTFVGLPTAHTETLGFGASVAIFDNGLNPHPWTDPRITDSKLFRLSETNGVLGGSHGNPVSGLVFAIAPDAKGTNYKIGSSTGGGCSWTDVSNAFLYAKDKGYKIFNLSWGGGSSLVLADTLKKCKDAGIAIWVAAGNSSDATKFPANNTNVYAVSSVATSGMISGFSCRGKIQLATPGEGLLSSNDSGAWGHFSGTSGACPIAAGICALVSAQNPTWTGVQCAERVLATATPKEPITDYGAGHANAAKAVGAEEVTPPPPPPPPEPPPVVPPSPPPSGMQNITNLAQWQTMVPALESHEGLSKLTDGQVGTKCLHFNKWTEYIFDFGTPYFVDKHVIWSANDYPQRDAQDVFLYRDDGQFHWVLVGEWTANGWTARHQKKEFPITAPRISARRWKFYCGSSGQTSPGDRGTGILQIAELEIWGEKDGATIEPPPPPPPPPEPPKLPEDCLLDVQSVAAWFRILDEDQKILLRELLVITASNN